MGCSCKSNSGQKSQTAQVRKQVTVSGNVVNKVSTKPRKQLIIRRPAR